MFKQLRAAAGCRCVLIAAGILCWAGVASAEEVCVRAVRALTGEVPVQLAFRLDSASNPQCTLRSVEVGMGAGNTLSPTTGLVCVPSSHIWEGAGTSRVSIGFQPQIAVGNSFAFCITDSLGFYWNSGQTMSATVECPSGTEQRTADFLKHYPVRVGNKLVYRSEAAAGCAPEPLTTLVVNKKLLPLYDPGRFGLQLDGLPVTSWVGDGGTSIPISVTPGLHTVAEMAQPGTSLQNYRTRYGGDCETNGQVMLAAGEQKTCTIENTRLGRLEVKKVLQPANAADRFSIYVDRKLRARGLGNGGTTGLLPVVPGVHWIAEVPSPWSAFGSYIMYGQQFGGDCAPDGTVHVRAGETKTCVITNARVPGPPTVERCKAACSEYAARCLQLPLSLPGGPPVDCQELERQCRRRCRPSLPGR